MLDKIPRLLYIDDEPYNLELFQLTFIGKLEVLLASSAKEGLNILASDPTIDLVIADLEMPITSGIEFIKIAKKIYPDLPFYVLSGYDYYDECEKLDFVAGFFQKPFQRDVILNLGIRTVKESETLISS